MPRTETQPETSKSETTAFVDIAGWPGYLVDQDGGVWSAHNWRGASLRQLSVAPNKHGYLRVRLTRAGQRKGVFVHKIAAAAYLPARPTPLHEIRHLDGNKLNNSASNLAWGTRSENAQDRVRHGRQFMPPWSDESFRAKAVAGMHAARARKRAALARARGEAVS